MYRYIYNFLNKESLYIAGPECFYEHGYDLWFALKAKAEALGFKVVLPNNHPLDTDNSNLQKRADSIFADLKKVILNTTTIVADLEAYRGCEADSGTVYELGMAYAKGARCYGYTRDKRSLISKNQKSYMENGKIFDEHGNLLPYGNLPFSPAIIGSTKIIEGDFDDCLKLLITDIEEEYKRQALNDSESLPSINRNPSTRKGRTRVYLAGLERYDVDGCNRFNQMKSICAKYNLSAVSPLDWAEGVKRIDSENSYVNAASLFNNYQQQVRNCDVVLADLNNFRGYEISNDIAFECGMGFQLGKKLFGYIDDASPMIEKIPNLGENANYRDQSGCNVENFNYPVNLMFGSSMRIYEGRFEDVISDIAHSIGNG